MQIDRNPRNVCHLFRMKCAVTVTTLTIKPLLSAFRIRDESRYLKQSHHVNSKNINTGFFFSPLSFISRVFPLGNRENYSVMSTTEPPSVFFLPDSRCSTEHVGFTVCVCVCACVCVCVCLPASTTEPIAIAGRNPWSPIKRSGERSHARLMTPSGRNKRSAACENPGLWDLIDSSLNKHHWYVSHGMFHPQLRRGGCREQLHPLLSLHSRSKMLWW